MSSVDSANCVVRWRTLALAIILILPIGLLFGCGKSSTDGSSSIPDDDSDVVATVNGVPIVRGQMYSAMEQYVPAQIQDFPRNPLLGVSAGQVALQQLINNELTLQLAAANGVPVTQSEIDSRYADVKMVKNTQSTTDFADLLGDQGLTARQFEDQTITPDVAQFNLVSKGIIVADSEILANYNEHIADYTEPSRVHIERVALADKQSAEAAYQTAIKANSLDDVLDQNIAPPAIGGENSADITEWIKLNQPTCAITPVLNACATAVPGSILPPVKLQNEWWVIKVIDRQPKQVLPFDQVKHMVAWNVIANKAVAAGNIQKLQSDMQMFRQSAVITVKEQQYISLVKQLQNPNLVPATEPADPSGN